MSRSALILAVLTSLPNQAVGAQPSQGQAYERLTPVGRLLFMAHPKVIN